jgi:flagellar biosynthesis/type III secretory pathway protein FliH
MLAQEWSVADELAIAYEEGWESGYEEGFEESWQKGREEEQERFLNLIGQAASLENLKKSLETAVFRQ